MSGILLTPNNLTELDVYLQQADQNNEFISGGTDMILKLRENGGIKNTLIDLSAMSELNYIKDHGNTIEIGAGTTLSGIVDSEIIREFAPMLSDAADQVGSTQIRNSATIGGNVANSFAGADTIPPLVTFDAEIKILGPKGASRTAHISEFITGNRKNILKFNEIIEAIVFKKPEGIQYFGKVGSRSRVTISKLNMAAKLIVSEQVIKDVKITFGALGTTAFRSSLVENYLVGKGIDALGGDDYFDIFTSQVDEAIPMRQSRLYKREAIKALADNLLNVLK